MEGKTMAAAAAAAGMSERTARRVAERAAALGDARSRGRGGRGRTRSPTVWTTEIEPLLVRGQGGRARGDDALRRGCASGTRGVSSRAAAHAAAARARLAGAARAGARGVLPAGRTCPGARRAIDFTHATELGVTIAGRAVRAPVVRVRARASAAGRVSSSRSARPSRRSSRGSRARCGRSAACPRCVRHDNLSAATHELRRSGGRALTERFRARARALRPAVLARSSPASRTRTASSRRRITCSRRALAQALLLRGHRDFATSSEYMRFVQRGRSSGSFNRAGRERGSPRSARICVPLPSAPVPELHDAVTCQVRRWSTIRVARPHLLGAFAADRPRGRSAAASRRRRGLLSRADRSRRCRGCAARASTASTTGTSSGRWCASPAPSRATAIREELFPSLVVPARLRRAPRRARRPRRRRVRAHPAPGREHVERAVEQALTALLERRRAVRLRRRQGARRSPRRPTVPVLHIAAARPAALRRAAAPEVRDERRGRTRRDGRADHERC